MAATTASATFTVKSILGLLGSALKGTDGLDY
jgi:hypothetical protein